MANVNLVHTPQYLESAMLNAVDDGDPQTRRILEAAAQGLRESLEKAKACALIFPANRAEAFSAINSERDYQDKKWGGTLSGGRPGDGSRTVDEFALYIAGYADDLVRVASHFGDTKAKLEVIRKIAGLCVACMEQHGAPLR